MIKLYKNETENIDITKLDSLCFDGKLETQIEQEFAEYIGAQHACIAKSPYDILYLILEAIRIQMYDGFTEKQKNHQKGINSKTMYVPSTVPLQIVNSILNAGLPCCWDDNPAWIGKPYTLVDTGEAIAYHSELKGGSRPGTPSEYHEEGRQGFKLIYSGHFIEPKYYQKRTCLVGTYLYIPWGRDILCLA